MFVDRTLIGKVMALIKKSMSQYEIDLKLRNYDFNEALVDKL